MALTLTKKITGIYANGWPDIDSPESVSATVTPYIAEMVTLGKTDGVFYPISDTSSYRLWTDQTSAQNFADLVVNATAGLGRTDFSYTITDI